MEDRCICILGLFELVSMFYGFDMEMCVYNYKFGNLYLFKLKGICNGIVFWIVFYSCYCFYKGNYNICCKIYIEFCKIFYYRDSLWWICFVYMYLCCGKYDWSICFEFCMMCFDIWVDMYILEILGECEYIFYYLDNLFCI